MTTQSFEQTNYMYNHISPEIPLKPAELEKKDRNLCKRLDELYALYDYDLKVKPSDMFQGALFAMRPECRSNPDWMAQTAHSLREILYHFNGNPLPKREQAFKEYGSVKTDQVSDVGTVYGKLTELAHHGNGRGNSVDMKTYTDSDFEQLVSDFKRVMFDALTRQFDIHSKINDIVNINPEQQSMNDTRPQLNVVREIISLNFDAQDYFFSKVDERWIDWLWDNGLLDVVKKKAEDPTRYGYRTPELNYLVKVAEKKPRKVTEIILQVHISKETFNPEVIDEFLTICSTLPADQLARLVPKIKEDGWVELMSPSNNREFDYEKMLYEKMLSTLAEASDYESLLLLIEAVSVRLYEKSSEHDLSYTRDLSYTKVFEYLTAVDETYTERALILAVNIMSQIVLQGGEDIYYNFDIYYLDIDFFSIQPGQKEHLSKRNDVRELAAVIKILTERLIIKNYKNDNDTEVRRIYDQNIDILPPSRVMWKLRLYVLSICPTVFKDRLKESLFSLFGVERYSEIISGTEYENTLKKAFPVFSKEVKHDYVKKIIEYFSRHAEEKEDQERHKRYGSDILSTIAEHLLDEEREEAEMAGFTINPEHVPEPTSTGVILSDYVVNKGPVTQEEFAKLSIDDIATKLRNEWSPEELNKHNTSADFLNPLNAEGAGELLHKNIPERLQEYASKANLFFERDVLDQHYTCSFLRGIQEAIENNKQVAVAIDWSGLIDLLDAITKSGLSNPFGQERREQEKSYYTWLFGWNSVHSAMAHATQAILRENGGEIIVDFDKYRDHIFRSINYLLSYPDPLPADEELKTASMTIRSRDKPKQVVDACTMAINTVRGLALETLVIFLYPDGKKFKEEDKIKIADDVKDLYEKVLDAENTRAVMFQFGYYIRFFYYRDTEWIHGLISKLFPTEKDKEHLYLASWEGFLANLANNLYYKIFDDSNFQALYERGLLLTKTKEDDRKHFQDPDKGIATHLALAFIRYEEVGFDHPLFKLFWERDNMEQHSEFVSFVGRSIISGDNARLNELLNERPEVKELLKELWDRLLDCYRKKELFMKFGSWVNLEKDIFDSKWLTERVKKTLEKTEGKIDYYFRLTENITKFASESPEDTLEIIRLLWLENGIRGNNRLTGIFDQELYDALVILCAKDKTRAGTESLINKLISEGGDRFWHLKKILKQ